jgi:prepilin-type N-terminal cleavage/methylation domain-containing protein
MTYGDTRVCKEKGSIRKVVFERENVMRSRKGFTLIELMIVVIIVAVLAAVIVPLMTSRINKAKWSEAKAAMSQIATALRAYVAENEAITTVIVTPVAGGPSLGFKPNELDGKYFLTGDYQILGGATYDASTGQLSYTIRATAGARPGAPTGGPLDMVCNAGLTTWSPADL